jgi:hypothetical protein
MNLYFLIIVDPLGPTTLKINWVHLGGFMHETIDHMDILPSIVYLLNALQKPD